MYFLNTHNRLLFRVYHSEFKITSWRIRMTVIAIKYFNIIHKNWKRTYPMMELVAIMKPSCSFVLKNFDFIWTLMYLSELMRIRYTSLVLSPIWTVSLKCFVSLLRSSGWHKFLIIAPTNRSCNRKHIHEYLSRINFKIRKKKTSKDFEY